VTAKPFPPSPRRLAIARQAGLHATSPVVVAGVACAAAAASLALELTGLPGTLGEAVAAACSGRTQLSVDATLPHNAQDLQPAQLSAAIATCAIPIAVVAIAALLAHLAQTRALWLPRRRIEGSPTLNHNAGTRLRAFAFELAAAATIGAITFMWLWLQAPRIASLIERNAVETLRVVPLLAAMFVSWLASAWVVFGIADSFIRHIDLSSALAMTAAEKREDDRLAGADPRWAKQRAALSRAPTAEPAVQQAAVILLGDELGIAIAWDPLRQPIPARVARGRGALATQLVGLARRHGIAVHRDPTLVAALSDALGPVPDREWARLAEIIAAVRR